MELKINSLTDINEAKKKLEIQEQLLLTKGMSSNDPDQIIKAVNYFKDIDKRNTDTP